MRCVVFDPEDMEALTVVNVPQVFIREIEQGTRDRVIRFPIWEDLTSEFLQPDDSVLATTIRVADVRLERFVFGKVWTWCAMALNPEVCLLMKSDLLPGQRRDDNERRRRAFADGFCECFDLFTSGGAHQ